MDASTDPRTHMLIEMASDRFPRELLEWLLHSFDTLEQTDFGELEPVGVAAPTAIGPHK
jgi:hypothetical protein